VSEAEYTVATVLMVSQPQQQLEEEEVFLPHHAPLPLNLPLWFVAHHYSVQS
jgi:hypothetical protein